VAQTRSLMDDAPILVTGAASGIGLGTTQWLLDAGRSVIGLDRRASPACETLLCDLADPAAIDAAVADLPDQLGGVANVAGVPGTAPTETVLSVNLLGVRHLTAAVVPRLVPGSAVVNVASVVVVRDPFPAELVNDLLEQRHLDDVARWCRVHPLRGADAYKLSKQALIAWTLAASVELRGHGIRVVSVSPGVTDTAILDDFRESMGNEAIDRGVAEVGRLAVPGDIAPMIGFLLGPEAAWVNAVDIRVDGGLIGARLAPPIADRATRSARSPWTSSSRSRRS
jgi:NAD(P)-dependent dehydrogenase (short-subunit alcohol dehydrogenase family)